MPFRTDISLLVRGRMWSRLHHHHVLVTSVAIAVIASRTDDMMEVTGDTTGITVTTVVTRMFVGLGMLILVETGMEMVMEVMMDDVTDTEETIDGLAEMVAMIEDDVVTRLLALVPIRILQIRMCLPTLSPTALVQVTEITKRMLMLPWLTFGRIGSCHSLQEMAARESKPKHGWMRCGSLASFTG